MSRAQFGVAQFVGFTLAEWLLPQTALITFEVWMYSGAVAAVYGFMGTATAIRLRSVGASRLWAFLALGPALLQFLFERSIANELGIDGRWRESCIVAGCVAMTGYVALVVLLLLRKTRSA